MKAWALLTLLIAVSLSCRSASPPFSSRVGDTDAQTQTFSNTVASIHIRQVSFSQVTVPQAVRWLSRESGIRIVCESDVRGGKKFGLRMRDCSLLNVLTFVTQLDSCVYRIERDKIVIS